MCDTFQFFKFENRFLYSSNELKPLVKSIINNSSFEFHYLSNYLLSIVPYWLPGAFTWIVFICILFVCINRLFLNSKNFNMLVALTAIWISIMYIFAFDTFSAVNTTVCRIKKIQIPYFSC